MNAHARRDRRHTTGSRVLGHGDTSDLGPGRSAVAMPTERARHARVERVWRGSTAGRYLDRVYLGRGVQVMPVRIEGRDFPDPTDRRGKA